MAVTTVRSQLKNHQKHHDGCDGIWLEIFIGVLTGIYFYITIFFLLFKHLVEAFIIYNRTV